jgi:hypothetical protein
LDRWPVRRKLTVATKTGPPISSCRKIRQNGRSAGYEALPIKKLERRA